MNEFELIALKMNALIEAERHARALEAAGQISLQQRDAWFDENRDTRDRLARRREKQNEAQGGTTPILTADQAQKLRTAVEKLQAQNMGEAAVRALLGEVLTVAEALADADAAVNDPVERSGGGPASRNTRTTMILRVALLAAVAGGVGIGLLFAAIARRRE